MPGLTGREAGKGPTSYPGATRTQYRWRPLGAAESTCLSVPTPRNQGGRLSTTSSVTGWMKAVLQERLFPSIPVCWVDTPVARERPPGAARRKRGSGKVKAGQCQPHAWHTCLPTTHKFSFSCQARLYLKSDNFVTVGVPYGTWDYLAVVISVTEKAEQL